MVHRIVTGITKLHSVHEMSYWEVAKHTIFLDNFKRKWSSITLPNCSPYCIVPALIWGQRWRPHGTYAPTPRQVHCYQESHVYQINIGYTSTSTSSYHIVSQFSLQGTIIIVWVPIIKGGTNYYWTMFINLHSLHEHSSQAKQVITSIAPSLGPGISCLEL